MVLFSSFGNVDAPTPHGGPAFHGWKQGFGFGKGSGPGCHVMAPNMPMKLRFTPSHDRGFSATPFWRKKWEVGQAAGFGHGDRPHYRKEDSVAPNHYGDISHQVGNTRNNVLRKGITIHPKFPSNEERYRDLSWPQCGPGPGKYDTRIPAGQGSWFNPVPNPSFSMQSRPIIDSDIRAGMGRPGAGDYETRIEAGMNSPIRKGTLYDIKCKGRNFPKDAAGAVSPGPARYNHKDGFDSKGLLEKILNVPIPPRQHRRDSMPLPDGMDEDDALEWDPNSSAEEVRAALEKHQRSNSRGRGGSKTKLPRVASSPAMVQQH
jgi:hypothetical protein